MQQAYKQAKELILFHTSENRQAKGSLLDYLCLSDLKHLQK